ncbi:MAG: ribonuclease T2 family protein [Novosphingobium sp.]
MPTADALLRAAAMAALLGAPGSAMAQAYQCQVPDAIRQPDPVRPDGPSRQTAIGGFILAASWSPEYCNSARGASGSMQCSGKAGRFGFILHGLWPQASNGAPPQWCGTGARPPVSEIRRNLCMMPSPQLVEHEWAKHGACMAPTPEAYFAQAREAWNRIIWPDANRLSRQRGLTVGAFAEAFLATNPGWPRKALALRLSPSGWLQEVHLCFDARRKPAPCTRPGAADRQALKVWRGS